MKSLVVDNVRSSEDTALAIQEPSSIYYVLSEVVVLTVTV